ncbi:MAG TPA: TetR family transcriptional regulator, partial [Phytomonospora sp.]
VLGDRPDASMEEIAAEAHVTRQTVYAHFPSRDALMAALVEAAAADYATLLDAAELAAGRLTSAEAASVCLESTLRLCGAGPYPKEAAG